jgi:hypothetical protein
MIELLVLTNNPSRASFRQRIENQLESLRREGISCKVARIPSGELARFRLFKTAADFDCVFLHKKTLNALDAFWLRRYSKALIYDFDDAVMYYDKNPQRRSSRHKHTNPFRRTVKLADVVIAGNSYLAQHAKKFNQNVIILPTALDTKTYNLQIKPQGDGKIRLVWIGSKSTLKYLAEIKPALMQVEKCRWSLETQAKDLATADIGLAPLPDNRFTRGKCGFKALQYAAAALPTVASPVGVNAEYVIDGVTGYHASQTGEWVERTAELIRSVELRKQFADAAKKHIQKFDKSVIGKKLETIITDFIKPPSDNPQGAEA